MCAIDTARTRRARSRGAALLYTIFVLIMLALFGAALLSTTRETTTFTGMKQSSMRVTRDALAGAEEARAMLRGANSPIRAALTGTNQVVYVVNYAGNPSVSTDRYADPNFAMEPDPFHSGQSIATGFAAPPPANLLTSSLGPNYSFKWARVTLETENSINQTLSTDATKAASQLLYDPAVGRYINGTAPNAHGTALYQIVSYAADSRNSRTVIEELATFALNFSAPATVTILGQNPSYASPHSNAFSVSGTDAAGTGQVLPALGYQTGASTSGFILPKPNNYTGAGGTPSIMDVIANNYMPASLATVAGLQQFYQNATSAADVVCGAGTTPCPTNQGDGTGFLDSTSPQITVVNGDFTLPGSGGGVLVVTGNLTVPNNFVWHGLLMAVGAGNIQFASNGGGHPNVNGAIFAANLCGNTASPSPDLSNCTTMGNASFTTFNGGGNGGFQYDSAALNSAYMNRSYLILSYREQ